MEYQRSNPTKHSARSSREGKSSTVLPPGIYPADGEIIDPGGGKRNLDKETNIRHSIADADNDKETKT